MATDPQPETVRPAESSVPQSPEAAEAIYRFERQFRMLLRDWVDLEYSLADVQAELSDEELTELSDWAVAQMKAKVLERLD